VIKRQVFIKLLNCIGYDLINYLENKQRNDFHGSYNYKYYSGQPEQQLFRLTEENNFLNKSKSNLFNVQYTTVNKKRIGIKPEELHSLLTNPQKKRGIYNCFY
jgi:hypothetical protein